MRKVIISIASLLALSTSSLSFAWGHGGGWNHQHGFNPIPYVIAGAVIGAGGAIAYNSVPGPYYAPPRTYYEQPRTYYAPQPYVVQPQVIMQPPVVMPPQPYPYRPYY